MGGESPQTPISPWRLARNQHGVVARTQLIALGLTPKAIEHRIAKGKLHPLHRGVYAVGRAEVTRLGWWMSAVLSCGSNALLSHGSAAALWGFASGKGRQLHVSVPSSADRRPPGIVVHRRELAPTDRTRRDGIPVTTPGRTLIDLGTLLAAAQLEAAVNEADKLGLIDPEALRGEVDAHQGVAGVLPLRHLLDRRTFQLTDSELERRFLRLIRRAGLSPPRTRERVNGFRVDFHWPELGLVVETDGLRYHRTPGQQQRDRLRDQVHAVAGLMTLRFTHAQVAYEPGHVAAVLRAVAERIRQARSTGAYIATGL